MSPEKIKVLYLITELSIGGAQKALYRLLKSLDRSSFDPVVVCLYNRTGLVSKQIQELDIEVIGLEMNAKWRWDAFWRLGKNLSQYKPTILHTWMFHANLPGRILGQIARIPIIISSERTMGQEGYLRRFLNRLTSGLSDAIICVSDNVAIYAAQKIGIYEKKIFTIPNGIDISAFEASPTQQIARKNNKLPGEKIIIGAIGRPRWVKGFDVLISAVAKITELNILLLFVGDGPDQYKLRQLVKNIGQSDRIFFWGDQSEIQEILPILDILVNSSFHEGMSNIILEAMAAGLPVVATAVGGTPEVVVDGETGLLVPPGDPDSLAAALLRLIQDKDLRTKMGLAGRKRVRKYFTIEETVRKTETLYFELLREKGLIS